MLYHIFQSSGSIGLRKEDFFKVFLLVAIATKVLHGIQFFVQLLLMFIKGVSMASFIIVCPVV